MPDCIFNLSIVLKVRSMKNNRKDFLMIFTVVCLFSPALYGWGPVGHYAIGKIAEDQMAPETVRKVEKILGFQSVSGVGTWMDQIRSDSSYRHTYTWHWVTTADGAYDPAIQEKTGDAFEAYHRIKSALMKGGLSPEEEKDHLRMLIHIVGDLHQPFHVGKPGDRGGNDIRVRFFGKETNIHAVWDSDLIEHRKMSYTEIARELQIRITPELVEKYTRASPADWLKEAVAMREDMYDIPDNGRIGYEYIYKHYHHVEERLLAAGIRLARDLQEIYGG